MNTCNYDGETNDEPMHLIDDKKETETVEQKDIQNLMVEVETYRQAIQDAKDALASAEQELDEILAYEYENQ